MVRDVNRPLNDLVVRKNIINQGSRLEVLASWDNQRKKCIGIHNIQKFDG